MALSQRIFSDAFRDMQRAMTNFDRAFFDSSRSLINSDLFGSQHQVRFPATDMVETSDSYELTAELPGYEKNNIKIELADSRTLVLCGSVNEQRETTNVVEQKKDSTESDQTQLVKQSNESPQYWFKERVSGSFTRSFAFPVTINPDTIKASFENGILKVTVPKTTKANDNKQITID